MTVLFDFDGVIMDTERQYSVFWSRIGEEYLGQKAFGSTIKGQTLKYIYSRFFAGKEDVQNEVTAKLDRFEREMPYPEVPGALAFMKELHDAGVPTAVVTSSNSVKMENVYRCYPGFRELAGHIYTSEFFTKSKPDPECFLLAMKELGGTPADTVIFEDSVNGLKAARAAGAMVVGLTTSNPEETVREMSDYCMADFTGMSISWLADALAKRKLRI